MRRKQENDPDPHVPVHFFLCDGSSDQGVESVDDSNELETRTRPGGEQEGVPDEKLDDIMLELRDVQSEFLHVREMLGVMARRERCAETKKEIAARRLDRMKGEKDEEDDAEHEADLQEALTNQTKVARLVVDKASVSARPQTEKNEEPGDETRGRRRGSRRKRTEWRRK